MKKIFQEKAYRYILFAGLTAIIVLYLPQVGKGLSSVLSVLAPVFIGAFVAFVVNILVTIIEKKLFHHNSAEKISGYKRALSLILSFAVIAGICALIVSIVLPEFINSITVFIKKLPSMVHKAEDWIIAYGENIPGIGDKLNRNAINPEKLVDNFTGIIKYLTSNTFNLVSSVFGFGVTLIVGVIMSVYFVAGKEMLRRQLTSLGELSLGEKKVDRIKFYLSIFNKSLRGFIIGQTIEAVILGVIIGLLLFVLKFPYAVMIGSVIGVTALIPLLGAYIGGTFGFFMIMTQDPVKACLFVLILIIVQQLEGNVIYPKVVGTSVGLPGIWVFLSVIIGGGLLGVVGVFFSVPVASAVYKILGMKISERKLKLSELEKNKGGECS